MGRTEQRTELRDNACDLMLVYRGERRAAVERHQPCAVRHPHYRNTQASNDAVYNILQPRKAGISRGL